MYPSSDVDVIDPLLENDALETVALSGPDHHVNSKFKKLEALPNLKVLRIAGRVKKTLQFHSKSLLVLNVALCFIEQGEKEKFLLFDCPQVRLFFAKCRNMKDVTKKLEYQEDLKVHININRAIQNEYRFCRQTRKYQVFKDIKNVKLGWANFHNDCNYVVNKYAESME